MTDVHPDLAALLRADLDLSSSRNAVRHLAGCPTCQEELSDTLLGHVVLSGSARLLSGQEVSELPELPPPAARATPKELAPRPSWWQVAAAAVIALVTGLGLGAWVLSGGGDRGPSATPTTTVTVSPSGPGQPTGADVRTARLRPIEEGSSVSGQVRMATEGDTAVMELRTHRLPQPGSGHYYYVWLLDPETNKMLPLGQLAPGGSARFEIPVSLLQAYTALDVSLERDDGDPQHSPISVLRAPYA